MKRYLLAFLAFPFLLGNKVIDFSTEKRTPIAYSTPQKKHLLSLWLNHFLREGHLNVPDHFYGPISVPPGEPTLLVLSITEDLIHQDFLPAHFFKALLYLKEKNLKEAKHLFMMILEKSDSKRFPLAFHLFSNIRAFSHLYLSALTAQKEEAYSFFQEAVTIEPSFIFIMDVIDIFRTKGDFLHWLSTVEKVNYREDLVFSSSRIKKAFSIFSDVLTLQSPGKQKYFLHFLFSIASQAGWHSSLLNLREFVEKMRGFLSLP